MSFREWKEDLAEIAHTEWWRRPKNLIHHPGKVSVDFIIWSNANSPAVRTRSVRTSVKKLVC